MPRHIGNLLPDALLVLSYLGNEKSKYRTDASITITPISFQQNKDYRLFIRSLGSLISNSIIFPFTTSTEGNRQEDLAYLVRTRRVSMCSTQDYPIYVHVALYV